MIPLSTQLFTLIISKWDKVVADILTKIVCMATNEQTLDGQVYIHEPKGWFHRVQC